ncbi:TetR/AcrR family transcriptional regulator [Nesterenkonia ebinurensis]|uniref:TetR/AcrR family transcriptional regulator n=1 Tax=Nesterenkonia ebinurensis TaxID=2608252 RepID=UPI00123D4E94|nr:TetR/AcrR family transcriptional regulator [Nesterenkonia ebinurensis]
MSRSNVSYHHGNLAVALEEAALALLVEEGSSALSLRAVARRAGVSHNAPYHHFGDRQGLLKSVAARGLRDLLAAMVTARDSTSSPKQRLLAASFAYVDFASENRPLFELIFDPEICNPKEPNPVTGPLIEANDEFLAETVRAALPQETAETDVRTTAAALWGAVHGLAVLVSTQHLDASVVRPGLESLLELRFLE